jgi:hypothetical protein
MGDVVAALAGALRDIRAPRILAVLLLPMAGAILVWAVLSFLFWDSWSQALAGFAADTALGRWLQGVGAGWLLHALTSLGVIVLVLPATFVTALVINEIVVMPAIVAHVSGRYFPRLERRAGGTLAGSAANALAGIAIFCLLWIATLPLWLTGVGAVILPVVLSAYLNQRLLRYDALSEHATREEYARFTSSSKGKLYALGVLVGLLYYVPFVNLLAPVASGLAFAHLSLSELARMRQSA